MALALALRLPWLEAPLGVDEGGVALVAQGWLHGGDSLYGHYWLDRPPLLVALYKLALTLGPAGVRVLGAVAAAALVVLVALIARSVGGDRAARPAALIAGLAASSAAIQAVFTPAELLAIVPSAASVLALVIAHRRGESLAALAAAGACAACAVLVKQSFLDALLAGGAFLAVAALRRGQSGFRARWALAYLAGAALPYAGVEVWERLAGLGDGAVSTALLGFRVEALLALQGSARPLLERVSELALPALGSGVALMVLWTARGLLGLREDRVLAATLGAWLAGGLAGVLAGGSYWPHYLIQLVPVTAVATGVALAKAPRRLVQTTLAALLVLAIGGAGVSMALDPERSFQASERSVGVYVRDHAERGDTVQVLYARANVVYFSGLRSPYPYQWSLMLRARPGSRERLQRLLTSGRRPTWLVRWQRDEAWGLDPDGAVKHVVGRRYRRVATVCGRPIYLRRDVTRAVASDTPAASCTRAASLGL
ncbi:MAG: hypothetical protein ACR2LH_09005 [Thermoleophilaceae bacterium]